MEKEKSTKLALIQTILIAAILVVVLAAGGVLIGTLSRANTCMQKIEQTLDTIDAEQLQKTVTALESAASNLGKLDMDSFNEIMNNLNNTTKTLQNVTSLIDGLFGK